MHVLGVLELLVQIYFAVHAGRTGRFGWIFIIIFVPVVGSAVYFFVEFLPELQDAAKIRKARNYGHTQSISELKKRVAQTDSVQNKVDLAEALFQDKQYHESISLLKSCLIGTFKNDPHILEGLFYSYYCLKDYNNALKYLVKRENINNHKLSDELKLGKAKLFEELNKIQEALDIYKSIINTAGEEARCRYALLLSNNW